MPVRQALRAACKLCRRCARLPQREDVARERAVHEFGEPRGPRRHGVRPESKLPSLVFKTQTCAKDSTYVGVDVVRCRRNGLANAPFLPGRVVAWSSVPSLQAPTLTALPLAVRMCELRDLASEFLFYVCNYGHLVMGRGVLLPRLALQPKIWQLANVLQ